MDKRVGFENSEIKKQFFTELKEVSRAQNWRELAESFGISLKTFQNYQYDNLTIPGNLFNKFIEAFSEEKNSSTCKILI